VTLLFNRGSVSRVKLCLVSAFPDIVEDCPKMKNLPKIFVRSFENVGLGSKVPPNGLWRVEWSRDIDHVTLKGLGRDANTLWANISKTAGLLEMLFSNNR